jgi:hypothetical protein
MGFFDSIKDLQETAANQNKGGGRQYLTLEDGDKFRVRFLQELSKDGKGYDEEAGTANVVDIHQSPYDFKKKLACTIESGSCWAHEQLATNAKWKTKKRVLLNVAVLEKADWVSKVLDQTLSDNHVITTLIEYAAEYGSIVDRDYNISRSGKGMNDTSYKLIPLSPSDVEEGVADLVLADLAVAYKVLPYDEQEAFFLEGATETAGSKPASGW